MKKIILILLLACLIFSACEIFDPQQTRDMISDFSLTDTLGREISTFHSGEDFILSVSLINSLDDTVFYTRPNSGPLVTFSILSGDSTISSSTDGWDFLCVIIPAYIAPGDTESVSWMAPASLLLYPEFTLEPGFYSAKAAWNISDINECPVDSHDDIDFTIIR